MQLNNFRTREKGMHGNLYNYHRYCMNTACESWYVVYLTLPRPVQPGYRDLLCKLAFPQYCIELHRQ